ncbi:MAG: alpha-amylase family glycosyl hydrolase [Bryobacteraceae bacterium]|jgi:glycosidase
MIRATLRRALLALFVLLAAWNPLHAQYATPVIDGIIEPGEYGNTANATNQISTSSAQTWYMTWDATNLYVGIANANLSEAAVIYIDSNPLNPPGSGTNANGSLAGFNYDGTDFASLPFRAQFVTYFKDGYNEYRNSNGSGGWGNQTSNYGTYADNSNGNVREFAIPWSAITGGGIPSSFLFFGYLTSSTGYVYGQVPNDNGGANIGTSATYTQYFAVNSTANGASTPPFSTENSDSSVSYTALYHNTFLSYYRSQEGAVPAGTTVTLRLQTAHLGATGVNLRVYLLDTASGNTTGPFDSPMAFYQTQTVGSTLYDYYTIDYTTPTTPTIVYYKFEIFNGSGSAWYSDDYIDDYDNLNKDGTGVASATEPFDSFQITAFDPAFQTPAWMAVANVYHIFPDRFRQGNPLDQYCVPNSVAGCPSFYGAPPSSNIAVTPWNTLLCDPNNPNLACYNNFGSIFYGGDLLGIQNQLDYIQGLGFDTLYLNPIFYGDSNHRYDTDDFLNIDPGVGGDSALTSLLTAMNQRGMRAIFDGTFEDASSDSTYFNEYNKFSTVGACQSLSSQWRIWFQFLDSNVPCATTDYNGWDGFTSLPLLDTTQSSVQQFFYSGTPDNVLLHWYTAGAAGWRFDSAPNIPSPYWHALRPYAKSYNANGPLIGEIWPNASQWLAGDQMDSTMNYRFRRNVTGFVRWPYNWVDDNDNGNDSIIPLTPSQFDTANRAIRDDYPPQATAAMLDLIDSHDTNRALYVMTELGDNGLVQAKQRLELAALFQFTYIGAPTVFYGDEVAINAPSLYSGSNGPVGDPYCRAPYPWTDQAGDPTVYGPPDQNVMAYYTALSHLRKQHASLTAGTFATLLTGDTQQPSTAANSYAFARTTPSETAVVALNNGSAANTPVIPVGAYYSDGTVLQDAIGGATYTVSGGNITLTLNALSGVLLLPSPASPDLTPPTAVLTLSPPAGNTGWNNASPVSVNITATDTNSGVSQILYWVDGGAVTTVASASALAAVNGQGSHTVGVRVLDNAGNISQQYTESVNIDLTPPATIATPTATPNGAGWYSAAVTINLAATDTGGSGVAQIQYSLGGAQSGSSTVPGSAAAVTISANGATTLTYFATDNAGNIETAHMLTINVDNTIPAIVPTVTGASGANGWYVSNVTVAWTVTESYSGVASSTGCGPATLSTYTAGTTLTCSATSVAGLTNAGSVTIKVDEARVHALAPSGSGALTVSNAADVTANGEIVVNSSSAQAMEVKAKAKVTANAVDVTGGVSAPSGAITPTPVTGVTPRPDPLATLSAPTYSGCNYTNYRLTKGTATLNPGVYCGGITILAGTATFNPGVYIVNGGGLSILTGSATGTGVTFYITSNGHPYGPVTITTGVNLSAPSTGPLAGVLFFEDRTISSILRNTLLPSSTAQLNGTLYFPATEVLYSGATASTGPTIIVANSLLLSGTVTLH